MGSCLPVQVYETAADISDSRNYEHKATLLPSDL